MGRQIGAMDITVSVIVPVYNTEYWLNGCIISLQNQTLENIEIILVDDGSTDMSGAICDAYAEVDNRIKVIHQQNHGVSSARNAGIKVAGGLYLMFCDSDDYVDSHWCEYLYNLATSNPDAWISSGFSVIANSGLRVRCIQLYNGNEDLSIIEKGDYLECFKSVVFRYVYNQIFDRNIVIKNGIYFDEQCDYGEDNIFSINYMQFKSYGISSNRFDLYYYRYSHGDSLSTRFVGNKIFKLAVKVGGFYERFLTKEELHEYWKYNFWNVSIGCLSSMFDDRCPYDLEHQISECQAFIDTDQFQKWCHEAVSEDCEDMSLKALREGNFRKAYPYFVKPQNRGDNIYISIIVTVDKTDYNLVLLDECIQSLLNQAFKRYEIILAGDIDFSDYAKRDARIRTVYGKEPRTSAVRVAKGKYILFCNANDYVKPLWCDVMYHLVLNNRDAWICTGYMLVDNEGNIIDKIVYNENDKISIIRDNEFNGLINTQIFKREILIDNNYNLEDNSFILEYRNNKKFGLYDNQEPFYCHRIDGGKRNED